MLLGGMAKMKDLGSKDRIKSVEVESWLFICIQQSIENLAISIKTATAKTKVY